MDKLSPNSQSHLGTSRCPWAKSGRSMTVKGKEPREPKISATEEKKTNGSFHRDKKGTADIVGFLLATPFFIIVAMLSMQTVAWAQTMILLHHGAFVAARSALVHACPPIDIAELVDLGTTAREAGSALTTTMANMSPANLMSDLGGAVSRTGSASNAVGRLWAPFKERPCLPESEAQTVAERAARIALIPASPAVDYGDGTHCDGSRTALFAVLQVADMDDMENVLDDKLCYAFDPENVEVTIGFETNATTRIGVRTPAVFAEVTYRFYVHPFISHILAQGRTAEGTPYRAATVRVALL